MSLSELESAETAPARKLEIILKNSQHNPIFEQYLRGIFCVENLHFYEECQAFYAGISAANPRDSLPAAQRLFDKYVAQNSPQELNIDQSTRRDIQTRLQRGDVDSEMFESAKVLTFSLKNHKRSFEITKKKTHRIILKYF